MAYSEAKTPAELCSMSYSEAKTPAELCNMAYSEAETPAELLRMAYYEAKTPEEREEVFAQLEPREKLVVVLRAEVMVLDQALRKELKLREDLQLTLGRAQRLGREMVEALDKLPLH